MTQEPTQPQSWEERLRHKQEQMKDITDKLEKGIADLFDSDRYKVFLETMGKFHAYSLNNTILISLQCPNATHVASYNSWKNKFGRQVLKGEKGIRILAPAPYKKKIEEARCNPVSGEPMYNTDGSPQMITREVLCPAYKIVNVFDVSQTEGRELPTLGVSELTGDVEKFDLFFEALEKSCPVPITMEEIGDGAKGYYHTVEHRIAIQKDMSQVQTIKTAIHEMSHQRLHSVEDDSQSKTQSSKEVEAESVAYVVCQHYGIDTSGYSFGYIAGWSAGKEMPELKESLDIIRRTADEMITQIDEHMLDLQAERIAGIEYSADQREVIRAGLADQLDVSVYLNPMFTAEQMEILRRALISESFGYLSPDDVMAIAEPTFAPEEMKKRADGYRKQNRAEAEFDKQQNNDQSNLYRYYSTQRPIAPGTYPTAMQPTNIVNFDQRQPIEGTSFQAWGYLEYNKPLSANQIKAYELQAAPDIKSIGEKFEERGRKSVSASLKSAGARARHSFSRPQKNSHSNERWER